MSKRSTPEHLAIGRVLRPHGIRGELIVEPYSETIQALESGSQVLFGPEKEPLVVRSIRPHRRRLILKIDGIDDRNAVDAYRGMDLIVPIEESEPLPEGVYYRWQILGLDVNDEAGQHLGRVDDILETGANDVYVLKRAGENASGETRDRAKDLLIPATEQVILEVDLDAGTITVRLPEGLEDAL